LAAGSPEEAVWNLIEAANQAGGHDNITVVVVDVVP
jgi:serine/threonine protein phosphatase PrpC